MSWEREKEGFEGEVGLHASGSEGRRPLPLHEEEGARKRN